MMSSLSFTAPLLLAGLVILPALWWLLRATPPAPKRVPFGGLMFLSGLNDENQTPARTPWWLLLLRLAALALVIVGLSGPILNAPEEQSDTGPLLIIVDDSWAAAPHWRRAQEMVQNLALAPKAGARTVRLVTTAGVPTVSDPMPLRDAAAQLDGMVPKAALPDRAATLSALAEVIDWRDWSLLWLSDGVIGRRRGDQAFLTTIRQTRQVTLFRVPGAAPTTLTGLEAGGNGLVATLTRIGGGARQGTLVATSADGRAIADLPFAIDGDASTLSLPINLPLALRNEVARLSILEQPHAGAVWLLDAGTKRVRAGLVSAAAASLLDSGFYIKQALTDRTALFEGRIDELTTPETGLIVLDDIGTLRPADEERLINWVNAGGVLLRFAGPNTASAAGRDGPLRNPTYPVALRGGERSFGGALTWADPQGVGGYDAEGPFGDLPLPDDVAVRRQVLSRASAEPGDQVWAHLADGTPLVTARAEGQGLLILIHVTASPTWSDLPLSTIFPTMMDRLVRLAAGAAPARPTQPLAPYRVLNGYGILTDPPQNARPADPSDLVAGAVAPGLYGDQTGGFAVNTYQGGQPTLDPITASLLPPTAILRGPDGIAAKALGPSLLVAALVLYLADMLALLVTRWREARQGVAAMIAIGVMGTLAGALLPGGTATAQAMDLRPDLDPKAEEAALRTRFAYVMTGNPAVDRISDAGLTGLTREAIRRTALEPALPTGVDIERDDLSVYPLIYWPITADSFAPSDSALSRLEAFMAGGGMLIIDTQDGERQTPGGNTPAGQQLKTVLQRMDIPPLEPLSAGHILTKSFFRLEDLHGRNSGGTVWVEAQVALRETTDSVPSLIIAGRDWAAAWAVDDGGRPLRPAGPGGNARREYAFRTGINIAMVALTGNYKSDQVHVQDLLDQMGAP